VSIPTSSASSIAREKGIDKLHLLRLELASLLANFTEEHPEVITLRSEIEALERQLGIGSGQNVLNAKRGAELRRASNETPAGTLQQPEQPTEPRFVSTSIPTTLSDAVA